MNRRGPSLALGLASRRGVDQVGPGAECASSAREHGAARIRIVAVLDEGVVQRLAQPIADRVQSVRPIESNQINPAILKLLDLHHRTERLLRRRSIVLRRVVGFVLLLGHGLIPVLSACVLGRAPSVDVRTIIYRPSPHGTSESNRNGRSRQRTITNRHQ